MRRRKLTDRIERQFERIQDLIDFIGEQLVNEQSMLIVCDEQLSAE